MNLILLSDDLLVSSQVGGVAAKYKISLQQMPSLESVQTIWKDFPADLVIVDLMLPGVDVEDVIEWLRSRNASVTVIAFAPHVLVDKINQAKQAECDRVYVRGEFLSQLHSIVAQIISTRDKGPSI